MTLILSASDFQRAQNNVIIPELTGTARLHADIDSAAKGYDSGSLPSSSYCREWGPNDNVAQFYGGVNGSDTFYQLISSSVDGGAYSGSWGDNAISVRMWVRKGNPGSATAQMFVKNNIISGQNPRGYSLVYGSNTLSMHARTAGGTYNSPTLILTSDIWHRVRLDYIPIAGMKDIISLYTASAGGTNTETWELVRTKEILNSDPYYFTASIPSTVGYSVSPNVAAGRFTWIDDFDVYVTPVG